ncbi:SLAP domain-containing protein, partial [Lactobacillus intestinalis]
LRIVSAAAAALLAVAPIATVAVSNNSAVVQAADATNSTSDFSHINLGGSQPEKYVANVNPSFTLNGATVNSNNQIVADGNLTGSVTANVGGVTATANLVDGVHGKSDVKLSSVSAYTIGTQSVAAGTTIYDGTTSGPATSHFNLVKAGQKYTITIPQVGFNFGANNAGKKVTLALPKNIDVKFSSNRSGWAVSADGKTATGILDNNGTVNGLTITETVTAFDASNVNNPVFYNVATGEQVNDGTAMVLANYNGQLNISNLVSTVKSNFVAIQRTTTTGDNNQNGSENQNQFVSSNDPNSQLPIVTTQAEVKDQLEKAGIKVDAAGNFTAPHSFKLTVKATSDINGKSAELPVTFTVANVAAPKTEEKGVDKTIMHNAYYYDKDGQRVGKGKITRYETVSVVEKTVSINGQSYYKLANTTIDGKDVYVNADNIDGTKRTLKHNAYVYATSKKRANKQVLKKGTEVTTYGAPYTFKNGKKYYKINNDKVKTYVKASNF